MIIRKVLALRGPNIWSRHTVLEAWVDLGALKDTSSAQIPGFNDRLMTWLPTMIEHRCSVGERGGFFQRLRWGTYLAHILEHTTLELQSLCGTPVGYGRARETSEPGLFKVAIRYHEESLARACLETARELLVSAVFDLPFDIESHLKRLRELADRVCLGPSTNAIVDAARLRNIPVRRLNTGSLVQFGHGKKQRRIWTAETDFTSAIAESIAQDKQLTKMMLASAGIPVPEGREVESAEDAWEAAKSIEGAVVVKPVDGNHGRGVFMDLTSEEQVKRAYHEALKEGSGVIVERFASGSEHRLLVVGGSLGARALNTVVPQALALMDAAQRPIVVHQSGEKQIDALRSNYAAAGIEATLTPFIDNTAQAFADADLVLCRAGASTVTELAAVGAAAMLVPFPSAVDDHQTFNARFLVDQGAGWLVPQGELTPARLANFITTTDRSALLQRALAAKTMQQLRATDAVVAACEELAK